MAVSIPSNEIRDTQTGGYFSQNQFVAKCKKILSDRNRVYLFCLLVFLGTLVIINISLTLWLIAKLRIGLHGAGPISFGKTGVKIDGSVYATKNIYTNQIHGSPKGPLTVLSNRDILLEADKSTLKLKHNAEIETDELRIKTSQGKEVMKVTSEGLKTEGVKLSTYAISTDFLETSRVESEIGEDLVIETMTNGINMMAGESVNIESSGGELRMESFKDLSLKSKQGKIQFLGGDVRLPDLPIVNSTFNRRLPHSQVSKFQVFQVCICSSSGKLFAAPPDSSCSISQQFCK